jgi:hypothetical protein
MLGPRVSLHNQAGLELSRVPRSYTISTGIGIYRCEQEDCKKEMDKLCIDSALNISPSETAPAVVLAVATTLSAT